MVATFGALLVRAESPASHKRRCPSVGIELLMRSVEMPFRQSVAHEHAAQGACADADQRDEAARQRARDSIRGAARRLAQDCF